MRLDEIFDDPFELITDTPQTNDIKEFVLSHAPQAKNVSVFEASTDSKNVFIRYAYKGAWEIHHVYNYTSGSINPLATSPNPRFIGTVKKMYDECLDRGGKIRILAAKPATKSQKNMMDNYKTFVKIIAKKRTDITISPVIENFIGADGTVGSAIEISPIGKFSKMLNSLKKSVNFREDHE